MRLRQFAQYFTHCEQPNKQRGWYLSLVEQQYFEFLVSDKQVRPFGLRQNLGIKNLPANHHLQ